MFNEIKDWDPVSRGAAAILLGFLAGQIVCVGIAFLLTWAFSW